MQGIRLLESGVQPSFSEHYFVSTIKYPLCESIIPAEKIFLFLWKANESKPNLQFNWAIFNRPNIGECFLILRPVGKNKEESVPANDGFIYQSKSVKSTTLESGCQFQVTIQCADNIAKLEYSISLGANDLYFVHYLERSVVDANLSTMLIPTRPRQPATSNAKKAFSNNLVDGMADLRTSTKNQYSTVRKSSQSPASTARILRKSKSQANIQRASGDSSKTTPEKLNNASESVAKLPDLMAFKSDKIDPIDISLTRMRARSLFIKSLFQTNNDFDSEIQNTMEMIKAESENSQKTNDNHTDKRQEEFTKLLDQIDQCNDREQLDTLRTLYKEFHLNRLETFATDD